MKKNIFVFVLIIFIILTFPKMIYNAPFTDDAFAWAKACEMNLYNYTALLEAEGHCILWYLILMPFAKTNFAYPYSMFLINYLFCLLAILLLWKKSPFDNITKIIITFSFCFIGYYAILARCYTIGVYGLFLLAAYNKESLKHPLIYAGIIGLTANTSAFTALGTSGFLFIFFYDIFKNRKTIKLKDILLTLIILFLFFGFLIHPYIDRFENHSLYFLPCLDFKTFNKILSEFFNCSIYFLVSYLVCVFFILIQNGFKLNRSKFYLINSHIMMFLFMFFIHAGRTHHYFIFLIFIIISLWISNIKFKEKFLPVLFYISFTIILFTRFDLYYCIGCKNYQKFGEYLLQQKQYRDSVFFIPEFDLKYPLLPYILALKGETIDVIMNKEEIYKPGFITKDNNYLYNEEGNALVNEIRMIDVFYINKNTKSLIDDFANKINKKVYIIVISDKYISKEISLPKPETDLYDIKVFRIK